MTIDLNEGSEESFNFGFADRREFLESIVEDYIAGLKEHPCYSDGFASKGFQLRPYLAENKGMSAVEIFVRMRTAHLVYNKMLSFGLLVYNEKEMTWMVCDKARMNDELIDKNRLIEELLSEDNSYLFSKPSQYELEDYNDELARLD